MEPLPREHQWKGRLVRLRAVEPEDWERFWKDGQEDITGQRRGWEVHLPRSAERQKEWARDQATKDPEPGRTFLAIQVLATGELAGSINVHGPDQRNRTFQYGITLFPEHRRKGYASEAIRLLLRFYFEELGFQKANAGVYAFNEESLALHRKLGFVEEGRVRRSYYTEGRFHDEVLFGMTAEEFAERWA